MTLMMIYWSAVHTVVVMESGGVSWELMLAGLRGDEGS